MNKLPRVMPLVLLIVLTWSCCSLAGGRSPRNSGGISGVVSEVDDRYFLMKIDKGLELKVFISANTTFELNGAKSDSSQVKAGVHVKVMGTSDTGGKVIEASLVNVVGGGTGKTKSKSE